MIDFEEAQQVSEVNIIKASLHCVPLLYAFSAAIWTFFKLPFLGVLQWDRIY